MTIQSSRRERRIAARKSAILYAAGKLFAEKGYHRTTTKDIADAADVSEGTIYNYFVSKEDLLFGIMTELSNSGRFEEQLRSENLEGPREFLLTMLHQRHEFLQKNGAMLQALLSEILVNPELRKRYYEELIIPSQELLEQHLRKRVEIGQLRPIDPSMAARILLAMLSGFFILQVVGDPVVRSEWDTITRLLTDILFEGVSPDKVSNDP
jgi:AcrR family transcriptional regulator